jgi:hypothetical protein
VKRIQDEHDCIVVIDEKGPTKDLLEEFEDADVAVEAYDARRVRRGLLPVLRQGPGRPGLLHPRPAERGRRARRGVAGAVWRTVGDRQVWGRRKSETDVSMLEAATLAAYGAEKFGAFNIY